MCYVHRRPDQTKLCINIYMPWTIFECVCVCVRSFACIQADVVLHLDCEAYVARADFFLFNSLSYQSFVFSCVFVCIFSRILRSSVIATWNLTAHGTTYRFKISKGEYVFFMHSNCCERQLLKQAQNHFFFALQTYSRIFFSNCFVFCFVRTERSIFFIEITNFFFRILRILFFKRKIYTKFVLVNHLFSIRITLH